MKRRKTWEADNWHFRLVIETNIADDLLQIPMSSSLTTLVPVLDGTNYQQWASAMKSFLLSQGQWRVISKPAPVFEATTTAASVSTSGKRKEAKEDKPAEELTVTTDN